VGEGCGHLVQNLFGKRSARATDDAGYPAHKLPGAASERNLRNDGVNTDDLTRKIRSDEEHEEEIGYWLQPTLSALVGCERLLLFFEVFVSSPLRF
jgi:hypothetical protein